MPTDETLQFTHVTAWNTTYRSSFKREAGGLPWWVSGLRSQRCHAVAQVLGPKKKPRIKQFHDGGASAMKNGIGRGKRELRFNL